MLFRYVYVNLFYYGYMCVEIYFEDVKFLFFFNMIFEKMLRNKINNEIFKFLMIYLYNCLEEIIFIVKLIKYLLRVI